MRVSALLAACAAMAACACALGQSTTYTLTPEGAWSATGAPKPGTPEAKLSDARTLLARKQPSQAIRALDAWIEERRPDSHPLLPSALLARGDARTADGDEFKALYDYEDVIKNYPASEEFSLAVERELEIGTRYLAGLHRKLWGFRISDATDIGEELLVRVAERLPGSQLAERAVIELADFYYRTRDLAQAAIAYDVLLKLFPQSEYRQRAMQRRVFANIAQFKGPRYDASALREAQTLIRDFVRRYPLAAEQAGMTDALSSRLEESAAANMLEVGKWYIRRGDEPAARLQLRRLMRKHPQTVATRRAVELFRERGWEVPAIKGLDGAEPPVGPGPGPEAAPAPGPAKDAKEAAAEPAKKEGER